MFALYKDTFDIPKYTTYIQNILTEIQLLSFSKTPRYSTAVNVLTLELTVKLLHTNFRSAYIFHRNKEEFGNSGSLMSIDIFNVGKQKEIHLIH